MVRWIQAEIHNNIKIFAIRDGLHFDLVNRQQMNNSSFDPMKCLNRKIRETETQEKNDLPYPVTTPIWHMHKVTA